MSTVAKEQSKPFVLPPMGTHRARCYSIIDLGTQKAEFNGKIRYSPKVQIRWELSDELMKEDEAGMARPFSVAKRYTNSLHEKATLRHDLESWRGRAFTQEELKGFLLKNLLEVPCLLTIIHEPSKDGKRTYANIKGISPLVKGMEAPPKLINPTQHYEIEQGQDETFKTFHPNLQGIILQCQEWNKDDNGNTDAPTETPKEETKEDDIPF